MDKCYKIHEFARLIGVSARTLRNWDRDKILVANRHVTGHRYYTHQQYIDYVNKTKREG